jgi:hypothetical protein
MSFLHRPWLQLGVLLAALVWAQPGGAQESDDDDSAQESDDDDSADDSADGSEVVLGGGADDACSLAGPAGKSSSVVMLALALGLLRRKSS